MSAQLNKGTEYLGGFAILLSLKWLCSHFQKQLLEKMIHSHPHRPRNTRHFEAGVYLHTPD